MTGLKNVQDCCQMVAT